MLASSLLPAVLGLGLARAVGADEIAPRSTFAQVDPFGSANPSGASMYLYVPSALAAPKPPVVVGIHWCHGSATAYYEGTRWATLAETYGFIVVYPETPFLEGDACWDVASEAALTHGGGGDSNAIADMVAFVLEEYGGDEQRVFATGISSGAMMTNVMAAVYPELFAAGVIYSGVPAGCFMSVDDIPDYWNSTCAEGNSVASQEYWVNGVENMYPGYEGPYPKLQVYHGDSDDVLDFNNYHETIKLWTGIFGYDYESPVEVLEGDPDEGFTKYVYGNKLQGIVVANTGHNVPHDETDDLEFFGLDGSPAETTSNSATATATETTDTSTATATSTTTAAGAGQTHWGQCGGIGWSGPTSCESPYTCTFYNDYYAQCI
ncbi:putative acetylxylan esterase A [Zalerion maritima]|uniref:Carboxylic ester hydrolase n=1 Tax=Zalerion maritima TaxID=339359 RepID=A0AAD5WSC0_9PEZI|nr:putative acetylxylan esterase A [Zalerion maritima]